MGMSRFPITGMLKHNTDGEHYNSPFQGAEQATGVPVPKSKCSPGGMQAPKHGGRNSEIRNANSNAHHLCLNRLGSGQRRQQKPSDCSWVPAEQVWDLFLQLRGWTTAKDTKGSEITANPLGFTCQTKALAGEEIPRRYKPSASDKGTSPSDLSWGFINPFKGFTRGKNQMAIHFAAKILRRKGEEGKCCHWSKGKKDGIKQWIFITAKG